jgi:MFS family permease
MADIATRGQWIETDVPARMDRLPWSGWHLRVVIALGITWVLDGLEVTLVGSVAGVLGEPSTLHLSEAQIGLAASAYLAGAIVGALVFGRLTDMLGRKRLFLVTLGLYTSATLLTAFSWGFGPFLVFRALTGAGIGGEYSAINSAVDELIPARIRGRTDLVINSTYWGGTLLGAAATLVLLDPRVLPHAIGWRACFFLGGLLGLSILVVRRHLPESPRWLLLHGRQRTAEAVVADIEGSVAESLHHALPPPPPPRPLEVKGTVGFRTIAGVLLRQHLRRTVLGFSLMVAQAFAYNAIFFTYALILGRFYGVASDRVGLYLIPFAAGNLIGPILLGSLFDTVGRRTMISLTYAVSGLLLAFTGYAFAQHWLTAFTQTVLWCAVFFVASAAASSAYLTVSELFPVELRGMAIALFYSVGTAAGGLAAPAVFGALIQTGDPGQVMKGYLVGALLMLVAAGVTVWLGVSAEGKTLEELAAPVARGGKKARAPAPPPWVVLRRPSEG